MHLSDWLAMAEKRLLAVGVESARLEAQLLAAHVLLVDRTWILSHPTQEFPELSGETLLQRREAREPPAYILGWREFYGRRFTVAPGVLIPRQETETLVEVALKAESAKSAESTESDQSDRPDESDDGGNAAVTTHRPPPQTPDPTPDTRHPLAETADANPQPPTPSPETPDPTPDTRHPLSETLDPKPQTPNPKRVLDLGTGSGILAITLKLERPDWQVTGVDISPQALEIAETNAGDLGVNVRLLHSDGFEALANDRFDLIVSNPPYVALDAPLMPEVGEHEPAQALYSGETGLEFYERMAWECGAHLLPGGRLIVELGDGMADSVCRVFEAAGWRVESRVKDLLGIERCLVLAK